MDRIVGSRGRRRMRGSRPRDRTAAPAPRNGRHDLREGHSAQHDVEHRGGAVGAVQRLRARQDDGGVRRAVRSGGPALVAALSGSSRLDIWNSVDRQLQCRRHARRGPARQPILRERRRSRSARASVPGAVRSAFHDHVDRAAGLHGGDAPRLPSRRRPARRPRAGVTR